jgi:hypothetical protein
MNISFNPKSPDFYPTIKKVIGLIVAVVIIYFLFFSPSDYDRHMRTFNSCVKAKKVEKKYKYANIQEALNAYDFEVARDYFACHPDNKGDLNNRTLFNEIFGGGDYHLNPEGGDLEKIVTAEISFFTSQGEFQKAEASAKEANMMDLYEKISGESFEKKLDEMIEKKEFKKIYDFLLNKKEVAQKTQYDLNRGMSYNDSYMNSVRDYNAELDKVLGKYSYLKVDKFEIQALVNLALPELEDKNKNSTCGGCEGSRLVDLYKKEASLKYLK